MGWQHAIQIMQPSTAHRHEQCPLDKGNRTIKPDRRVLGLRPARLMLFYLGQWHASGNPVAIGAFARRRTPTLHERQGINASSAAISGENVLSPRDDLRMRARTPRPIPGLGLRRAPIADFRLAGSALPESGAGSVRTESPASCWSSVIYGAVGGEPPPSNCDISATAAPIPPNSSKTMHRLP